MTFPARTVPVGRPGARRPADLTPIDDEPRPGSLRAVLDPKRNAYNALRLLMAAAVVVWHSVPLTGHDLDVEPLRQLASRLPVDVFFALSGYLIAMSWARTPEVVTFLRARALRILPAFWMCLVLTAVVAAPLSFLLRQQPLPDGFAVEAVSYVLRNAGLRVWQYDIAGTPVGTPVEGAWNGSLWTLFWEAVCYGGVLVLGVTGLLRSRWALPAAYLACTAGVAATTLGPVHNWYVSNGSRFGIVFVSGALLWRWRGAVPVRAWLAVVAVVVLGAASLLPDMGLVAGLPVAYLALCLGAVLRHPALSLRTDVSYGTYIYGFPIQQLLATAGAASLGVGLFAVLSLALTLVVAWLSWRFVERPAMRLRKRRPRIVPPTDPVATVA